jgi:hypothetical protein
MTGGCTSSPLSILLSKRNTGVGFVYVTFEKSESTENSVLKTQEMLRPCEYSVNIFVIRIATP